jgi:chemotaxis protein CheD
MEIRVKVADLAVGNSGDTLVTIGLGSCVAIALYDADARIGGLAHVLLPNEQMARDRSNPAKFPGTAVPALVEEMARVGARRLRLTARLVGGASMFGNLIPSGGINVGERNVLASRQALDDAGIRLVSEDTGADHGRTVYFHLSDGRIEVRSLKRGNRVL